MIECKNLRLNIQNVSLFENVSFSVPDGEITCLLGRNGCGKSSLMGCIIGQRKYEGQILIDAQSELTQKELAKRISFLAQLLPSPSITVRELVGFGRYPYTGATHTLSRSDRIKIEEAMLLTDTIAFADRNVATLSGGERQKAFFAMLLAQDTQNVLMDEPTTYMDVDSAMHVFDFVRTLKKNGRAVLLVMHDIAAALEIADNFVFIHNKSAIFCRGAHACLEKRLVEATFSLRPHAVDINGKTRYII